MDLAVVLVGDAQRLIALPPTGGVGIDGEDEAPAIRLVAEAMGGEGVLQGGGDVIGDFRILEQLGFEARPAGILLP
jgi:hypothetical protein